MTEIRSLANLYRKPIIRTLLEKQELGCDKGHRETLLSTATITVVTGEKSRLSLQSFLPILSRPARHQTPTIGCWVLEDGIKEKEGCSHFPEEIVAAFS